jgi:C-terminal processing protease CtpA/Prc
MEEEDRQPNGTRYPYELPMVMPRADPRFRGHVWVLVDRHSYSNAASVAALVQDYGFGTIIGEETADVASNYASVQHFTLPRTGIVVTYPKSHFIRPNGKDEVAGVRPDIPIERPAVTVDGDVVLNEAIRIIGQASN